MTAISGEAGSTDGAVESWSYGKDGVGLQVHRTSKHRFTAKPSFLLSALET